VDVSCYSVVTIIIVGGDWWFNIFNTLLFIQLISSIYPIRIPFNSDSRFDDSFNSLLYLPIDYIPFDSIWFIYSYSSWLDYLFRFLCDYHLLLFHLFWDHWHVWLSQLLIVVFYSIPFNMWLGLGYSRCLGPTFLRWWVIRWLFGWAIGRMPFNYRGSVIQLEHYSLYSIPWFHSRWLLFIPFSYSIDWDSGPLLIVILERWFWLIHSIRWIPFYSSWSIHLILRWQNSDLSPIPTTCIQFLPMWWFCSIRCDLSIDVYSDWDVVYCSDILTIPTLLVIWPIRLVVLVYTLVRWTD